MRVILTVALIFTSISFSDTATQTDWSGGSGVPGPVTDWENTFSTSIGIDYAGVALKLDVNVLSNPVKHKLCGDFTGAVSVYATDVDGDGDTDVLGAAYWYDNITWWENSDTSPGIIWTEHPVDATYQGASSVYAADVDGDGDMDVLGAAKMDYDITWWENSNGTGTVWIEHTVDGTYQGASSVYSADVDGDGDMDVLGAAEIDHVITWWENSDGTGTVWTEHTVDGIYYGARSVYSADVDGDGDMDVLGATYSNNDITWWENSNGTGTAWIKHTVDGTYHGARSVYAADVDGDGNMDILGAASVEDDITWWENSDGAGTVWTEHTVDGTFNGAWSVYAADVDGDGDMDVLGAADMDYDITWWENSNGTGTVWTEHTVDWAFKSAQSVYAADVDGDGEMDVLGAAYFHGDIAWWDVMGYSVAGTLESSILDAGTIDFWDLFASNEQEPTGTSVGFQFRSSDDSASMGAWSDTVFTTCISLSDILTDSTNFVQYRVILQTTNPTKTPVLNDVSISYTTYLCIGDTNPEEITCWGLEPSENPTFGNFTVQVSVPHSAVVDLLLYDVTGRLIAEYSQELPGGEHSAYFNNLAQGVYFCTMCAGDFTATERIVVLK